MKVLRTLKATEDATSEPATQCIYLLCDTALALASAIVEVHSPGTASAGKYPGSVPLPKTFFRQLDRSQLKGERSSHRLLFNKNPFNISSARDAKGLDNLNLF